LVVEDYREDTRNYPHVGQNPFQPDPKQIHCSPKLNPSVMILSPLW